MIAAASPASPDLVVIGVCLALIILEAVGGLR